MLASAFAGVVGVVVGLVVVGFAAASTRPRRYCSRATVFVSSSEERTRLAIQPLFRAVQPTAECMTPRPRFAM